MNDLAWRQLGPPKNAKQSKMKCTAKREMEQLSVGGLISIGTLSTNE